jgi:hypothetical protein
MGGCHVCIVQKETHCAAVLVETALGWLIAMVEVLSRPPGLRLETVISRRSHVVGNTTPTCKF